MEADHAAQRQAEVMNHPLHAPGAARALRYRRPETLGEGPSPTPSLVTSEAQRHQSKLNGATAQGQINDAPVVAAVNPTREMIAGRTRC